MAATYTAEHLTSISNRRIVEYDIDDAANLVVLSPATSEACLPIKHFRRFIAMVMNTVGTGGLTAFSLTAATSAAGANPTTIVAHAVGSNPNAVGDYLVLECDIEQVHEVLATATHIGVTLDLVTSTDEAVIYFECADAMFPRSGLTADYVS